MYPTINNISEVLPAIEGCDDFIIRDDGNIKSVDYRRVSKGTFDGPHAALRRECRGIKFCSNTGRILARPYHKFFNVGERPETQIDAIDWTRPHTVEVKYDGSMVHTVMDSDGVLYFNTRAGLTPTAQRAWDFAESWPELLKLCLNHAQNGRTCIFEWRSPDDRIVIEHTEPSLVLTAVRENVSGQYFSASTSAQFDRDVVCVGHSYGEVDQRRVSDDMARYRNSVDTEGVVVKFSGDDFYKVKTDWYVGLHRIASKDSERHVVKAILEGRVDDLVPLYGDAVVKYSKAAISSIKQACADSLTKASVVHLDRASCFKFYGKHMTPFDRACVSSWYSGPSSPMEGAKAYILKACTKEKRYAEVLDIVGHRWADYRGGAT